ncbi:NUDIX domain-containing protein, partial [Pseudomonas juntendi]|uniref:NUDIX domain-containing protein n=1 Tax=Pseudomonas juntendi TaxID=2666183 RepID=UPI003B42E33A
RLIHNCRGLNRQAALGHFSIGRVGQFSISADTKIKDRATVLCLRSGRILLVRKKSGKWNFPGGAIEPGESPVAAAARELQEETSIEGHGLFHLCTLQLGSTIHHVFTTHVDDQEKPVARNEIVACKWVLRDKLSPAILNARAAELLSSQLPALTA